MAKDKDGYGQFSIKGRNVRAHRFSWEISRCTNIPAEGVIMHLCDNPSCVNPIHLVLGTNLMNLADMVRKGRNKSSTGCQKRKGTQNGNAKITETDVLEIRNLRIDGLTLKSIGVIYNLTRQSIWSIIHNKQWSHVTELTGGE